MARSILLGMIMLIGFVVHSGCASCGSHDSAPRPALINHVVFIELNSPDESQQLIDDCDDLLATIPTVHSYYCGRHLDIGRDTVLHDYDVAACMGFESEAGLRDYVEHPQHIELVNRWRSRIKRLRVYDVHDPTP